MTWLTITWLYGRSSSKHCGQGVNTPGRVVSSGMDVLRTVYYLGFPYVYWLLKLDPAGAANAYLSPQLD
jgi:hypothetical protein